MKVNIRADFLKIVCLENGSGVGVEGGGRGLPLYYYCYLTTLDVFVHVFRDKLLSMPSVLRVTEWPFELGLIKCVVSNIFVRAFDSFQRIKSILNSAVFGAHAVF